VPLQQPQRIGHRRRLKQLEHRHHITNDCHSDSSLQTGD
jgi:hypothetical protein